MIPASRCHARFLSVFLLPFSFSFPTTRNGSWMGVERMPCRPGQCEQGVDCGFLSVMRCEDDGTRREGLSRSRSRVGVAIANDRARAIINRVVDWFHASPAPAARKWHSQPSPWHWRATGSRGKVRVRPARWRRQGASYCAPLLHQLYTSVSLASVAYYTAAARCCCWWSPVQAIDEPVCEAATANHATCKGQRHIGGEGSSNDNWQVVWSSKGIRHR